MRRARTMTRQAQRYDWIMHMHPLIRMAGYTCSAIASLLLITALVATWAGPWMIGGSNDIFKPGEYRLRHVAIRKRHVEFMWFQFKMPEWDPRRPREEKTQYDLEMKPIVEVYLESAIAFRDIYADIPTFAAPGRGGILLGAPLLYVRVALCAGLLPCLWSARGLFRRKPRAACCQSCRYDRTGLAVNAPCPECGTPPRQ